MNDGGSAFPRPSTYTTGWASEVNSAQKGMTLRDWFAGMIICGLWSTDVAPVDGDKKTVSFEGLANVAYRQADAMLKRREE